MHNFYEIFTVIQIIILVYFAGNVLYLLFFAVCGFLYPEPRQNEFRKFRNITVVIVAFREDRIIDAVIKSAMQQDYPREMFNILLIADSFEPGTLEKLNHYPMQTVVANFEESTKVRALKLALTQLPVNTEFVVILDADNIMEMGFLRKLNLFLESGHMVVQCHRSAKNTNTPFALLDAVSEEVNNNIFRQGHTAIGLSSALIGSAMAFQLDVFRQYIPKLTAVGGFDKELELMLLDDGIHIAYLSNAFVLDEKVQNSKVFYKQRKRWMRSQLYYFGRDIFPSIWALLRKGNINYFDKTIQFFFMPRVLLLGILILVNLAQVFIPNPVYCWIWLGTLVSCILSILISTPNQYFRIETVKALLYLPMAFFLMFSILFRLRKANRHFIHTVHEVQT